MKRNLVLLSLVAALAIIVTSAFAGTGASMRIKVPFAFYVNDQLLPAGEYRFEMGAGSAAARSLVTVRDRNGMGVQILTTPGRYESNPKLGALQFNQYGDTYFLSAVSIQGQKANIQMNKFEREIRTQFEKARGTTILAQN
jgi:hypothetical protein